MAECEAVDNRVAHRRCRLLQHTPQPFGIGRFLVLVGEVVQPEAEYRRDEEGPANFAPREESEPLHVWRLRGLLIEDHQRDADAGRDDRGDNGLELDDALKRVVHMLGLL